MGISILWKEAIDPAVWPIYIIYGLSQLEFLVGATDLAIRLFSCRLGSYFIAII